MYFVAGQQSRIVQTFVHDYIERSISEHPQRPISIIIRKGYLAERTSAFGYVRALVANRLKRIVYQYFDSFEKIITFLLGLTGQKTNYKVQAIVIEDLHQYTGNNLITVGSQLIMLFHILERVNKVLVNNHQGKQFGSVIVSASGDSDFVQKVFNFAKKSEKYDFIQLSRNEQNQKHYLYKNGQKYNSQDSLKSLRQIQQHFVKKNK